MLFLALLPPGVPGDGPDGDFPLEIRGFGPIPARITGLNVFCNMILALRAAGLRSFTVLYDFYAGQVGSGQVGARQRLQ